VREAIAIPDTPDAAFYTGEVLGRVITYCEQVKTGTKLVAQLQMHRRHKDLIDDWIKQEGCFVRWSSSGDGNYLEAYIFKYEFVAILIEELFFAEAAESAPSALMVWCAGKLFGYADMEIGRFLEEKGYTCRKS
jgi:hypothetical protein